VILAGGYSVLVSLSLSLTVNPIYSVVLSTLLMTVFFALLSWRSFSERQDFIDQLRPFVTSARVYDQLLASSPIEVDIERPFRFLCKEVLRTRQAYLAARGPMASLVGHPLTYPDNLLLPTVPDIERLIGSWISPDNICIPLQQDSEDHWRWLIPLWSERGLVGTLLLGPKQDGGLYAQEEIEIARTVGERLIDMRASTEMARRLMALQRQRLAESQVVDRQTRRVLHDEVLPKLHATLLSLNDTTDENQDAIASISSTHRQISDLLRDLPIVTAPEVSRLGLIAGLQKTIEREFPDAFEKVTWEISESITKQFKQLSPLVSEVAYFAAREAVRNAARHGRVGSACPILNISAKGNDQGWEICIEDNGSKTPVHRQKMQGSGQGLTLHSTLMAVIGGALSFEQIAGEVTRVRLFVPKELE
jgi:signal transduction histidine kinase